MLVARYFQSDGPYSSAIAIFIHHLHRTPPFITSDKGGGKCFALVCLFVCLSVCLLGLARLLKNVCIDLDEMLRVDRCRDMDELNNF